jgi:hypothetical protein
LEGNGSHSIPVQTQALAKTFKGVPDKGTLFVSGFDMENFKVSEDAADLYVIGQSVDIKISGALAGAQDEVDSLNVHHGDDLLD